MKKSMQGDYQQRLAKYEEEKKKLLLHGGHTAEEFCWKLKELQDKWRI